MTCFPAAFARFLPVLVLLPQLAYVQLAQAEVSEINWPSWRGPQANGHTVETRLPIEWKSDSLLWQVELPGRGQSSPVIWGDRMFMTSALERGAERLLVCADRRDGKLLWKKSVWSGQPEPSHIMNGWASATCATDGQIVVAFFGRGGLHAFSAEGEHLWSRDLGPFESPWGVAACPIFVDDMVIQNGDSDEGAFIAAFDKRTGKDVWRTPRPDHRGWSTPIVIETGGHREMVLNGHTGLIAYDPKSGKELWNCRGFNGRGEPTVTPAGKLLCAVNGLAGDIYAVEPGGSGDVTDSRMAWHTPRKGGRDCPSPIVIGQFITVVDMKGIATCYDAAKGTQLWKDRISSNISASPIAAGGLAYFLAEDGTCIVLRPGPKLDIVATNKLPAADDELFRASPTPCRGQLFIRSDRKLYCIAGPNKVADR